MSWIKIIGYKEAEGKLKKIYNRVKGPDDNVDNVLLVHSLRPHTLEGHMALYKNVLHNSGNSLPKSYLEAIGVYVSFLNKCDYCVQHHLSGYKRLVADQEIEMPLLESIRNNSIDTLFDGKYYSGLKYAEKITLQHDQITEDDIIELREVGFTDGEILEINQVASYFNYVNRMVVGLGVNTDGDILGLSPSSSDDPENWSHS